MEEITGALIGIGLVLTAVFLPMAFFGGSTGVIYRQFSVTIVSAMPLSIMCALVLTPAFAPPCSSRSKAATTGMRRAAGPLLHLVQRQLRSDARLVPSRAGEIPRRAKTVMLTYVVILARSASCSPCRPAFCRTKIKAC